MYRNSNEDKIYLYTRLIVNRDKPINLVYEVHIYEPNFSLALNDLIQLLYGLLGIEDHIPDHIQDDIKDDTQEDI